LGKPLGTAFTRERRNTNREWTREAYKEKGTQCNYYQKTSEAGGRTRPAHAKDPKEL